MQEVPFDPNAIENAELQNKAEEERKEQEVKGDIKEKEINGSTEKKDDLGFIPEKFEEMRNKKEKEANAEILNEMNVCEEKIAKEETKSQDFSIGDFMIENV